MVINTEDRSTRRPEQCRQGHKISWGGEQIGLCPCLQPGWVWQWSGPETGVEQIQNPTLYAICSELVDLRRAASNVWTLWANRQVLGIALHAATPEMADVLDRSIADLKSDPNHTATLSAAAVNEPVKAAAQLDTIADPPT